MYVRQTFYFLGLIGCDFQYTFTEFFIPLIEIDLNHEQ